MLLTQDDEVATQQLNTLISARIHSSLESSAHLSSPDLAVAVRHEVALLAAAANKKDSCWEQRLRYDSQRTPDSVASDGWYLFRSQAPNMIITSMSMKVLLASGWTFTEQLSCTVIALLVVCIENIGFLQSYYINLVIKYSN